MPKKRLQEPPSSEQPTKTLLIMDLLRGYMNTAPIVGLCLALLYLATGERVVGFLSAASLIMFLTAGLGFLLIMTKTYGWHLQVEVSVDTGEMFVVMAYLLLTVVSLLVPFLSCMS